MRRSMRLALIVGAAATAMMLSPSAGAQETPSAEDQPTAEEAGTTSAEEQDTTDGREVYLDTCAQCHQGTGLGVVGSYPPLLDNPNVQDTEYLRSVIVEGKSGPIDVNGITFNDEMDPQELTDAEIDAVIEYILGGVFIPKDVGPIGEGNVAVGDRLFVGRAALENGGPSCHSCHSAGGHGNLGGPTLGPDLTDIAERMGGLEALAAALANPPSAMMEPVFDGKDLTDQERADLATYLASLTKRTEAPVDLLSTIGLAGAALMLGAMYLFSRRNKINYLQQLRSRA